MKWFLQAAGVREHAPVLIADVTTWRSWQGSDEPQASFDALEMHEDAVEGRRCLIVDDLLATGGTAAATARLVERLGGKVQAFAFVIELAFLAGRERLGGRTTHAIIRY